MDEKSEVLPALPYRSSASIGSKAIVGLRFLMAFSAVSVLVEAWYLLVVNEQFLGEEMHPVEWAEAAIVLLYMPTFLFTAICFCRWNYRSYNNLRSLGVAKPRYTPGWVVASYFIPILNLFRPFRAMKDIWNGSVGEHLEKKSPVVTQWWIAWILLGIVDRAAIRMGSRADSVVELKASTVVGIAAAMVTIIAAILAIRIISGVIERQSTTATEKNLLTNQSQV